MFSSMLSLLGSLRGGSSFITNSLRFRSSASAYLSRTPSIAGNRKTWTWSGWVKRGTLGATQQIFGSSIANNETSLYFTSSNTLQFYMTVSGAVVTNLITTQVFRDPSAWYNIFIQFDSTQSVDTNKIKIFINGLQVTLFSSNIYCNTGTDGLINSTNAHAIGRDQQSASVYFDGYLTDVNFIDGQALTPASFGAIDSSTGVWAPRPYSGTYGTNGFYLKFANTSSVAALGNDSSGNNNTWTVNNVSLTAGATYDSMIDVPVNYSDGGNGRGNYAVLNPLSTQGVNTGITNGNLSVTLGTAVNRGASGSMFVSSGKWYFEFLAIGSAGTDSIGVISDAATFNAGGVTQGVTYYASGLRTLDGVTASYGATYTSGDIIGVALDNDAGSIVFYKNNISQGAITIAIRNYTAAIVQASSIAAGPYNINFGQRPFNTANGLPPAGFRALNTNNLPTPSIVNGANFMAATTYTGNAAARSLSNAVNNVSFQPDLVWIKSRTPGATNHALFDSVRGTTKYLSSNTTTTETTLAQSLTAFGADGFSLGTDTTLVNANANSYVAWQWKAGGAAVSNTQGTITSQVSANTTAGFSVVTYTGTGVNATVGHGLGVAPKMMIVKLRSGNASTLWFVYHSAMSATPQNDYLQLQATSAKASAVSVWNNTAPTSSVFTVGIDTSSNGSGNTYVAYCFAEIAGFSRFGSYTGNGLADGPFVFCGFKPRFVMVKAAVGGTGNWTMLDTSRDVFNLMDNPLFADLPATETPDAVNYNLDGLSNGFKLRTNGTGVNASGVTYIFAAFAENPSKYALAR